MLPAASGSQNRVIRASDIGRWAYCQRAWWLAEQGYENQNKVELQSGVDVHEQHVRQVAGSHRSRSLGRWLILLGLLIFVAALLVVALSSL